MRWRDAGVALVWALAAGSVMAAEGPGTTVTAAEELPPLSEEDMNRPFFSRPILLGAHRGGEQMWPESTVEGFTLAAKRWPEILLETDARLTVDGIVVLLHDPTVDRTTDGRGRIKGMTLGEVKKLDAGYRFTPDRGRTFPFRGKGVTIPTLAEVLAALPNSRFEVDTKREPGSEAIVEATVKVIQEAKAEDRVLLASFDPRHMAKVRRLAPRIATCYGFGDGMEMLRALRGKGWETYRPTAHVLSLAVEMQRRYRLKPEEIRAIQAKGIRFQIHTLNEPEEIRRWLATGADSILTDRPDILADEIAARQKAAPATQAGK